MPSQTRSAIFEDCTFNIRDNVYEPAEDSFLFADNLEVGRNDVVLDVGTGCGLLGIIAARTARKVVALDINPHAIRCARENAESNHVLSRMVFVQCDLFSPLKTAAKFDLILFNAPYLPFNQSEPDSWLTRAWNGGASGREVIDRFISECSQHLEERGRIFLMQSTLSDVDQTLLGFHKAGFSARITAKLDLPFFEKVVLFKAECATTRRGRPHRI